MPNDYDLIVRNGTVVDGTGAQPFQAMLRLKTARLPLSPPTFPAVRTRKSTPKASS